MKVAPHIRAAKEKQAELIERIRNVLVEYDKGNIGFSSIRVEDDVSVGSTPVINVTFQAVVAITNE